jgi:hypothetical protein
MLDEIGFANGRSFVGADQIVKGVYAYQLMIRPPAAETNSNHKTGICCNRTRAGHKFHSQYPGNV